MLSAENNTLLTRVGPGTPMGDLMRRYWHPIAPVAELLENPIKKVRILGEDLVLFRDGEGKFGLIEERCPHRGASFEFGIPQHNGIRCGYHGWHFDTQGRCLDTPMETPDCPLKNKVTAKTYPAQALGGLVFVYLGPQPAPLLPRWDLYVCPNSIRQIGLGVIPCNWLQCQENSFEPGHNTHLHGHYYEYVLRRQGRTDMPQRVRINTNSRYESTYHLRDYGIRVDTSMTNLATNVKTPSFIFNNLLFPCAHRRGGMFVRGEMQIKTPIDDTNTLFINYLVYTGPPGIDVAEQEVVPYFETPLWDEKGQPILDSVQAQDAIAWVAQGPIADRTKEHLGPSDEGILMYRQLLKRQLEIVQNGGVPMNVFTDPEQNVCLNVEPPIGTFGKFPPKFELNMGYDFGFQDAYGPAIGQLMDLLKRVDESGIMRIGGAGPGI